MRPIIPKFMRKKPSLNRFLMLSAVLSLLSAPAYGQALSADEAARLALARPDAAQIIAAPVEIAEGDLLTARTRPNPVLNVEREGVRGLGGDGAETIIQLEQSFDIAGRRKLRRRGAEASVRAAGFSAQNDRLQIDNEARNRFYTALAAEQKLRIAKDYRDELLKLLELTQRREGGGEASRYDIERVRQETLTAEVTHTEAESDMFQARRSLAVLIGPDQFLETMTLMGSLLPDSVRPEAQSIPPMLAALEAEAEAADWRKEAASRTTPDITVGAGVRRIEGTNDDTGLLMSLSVPLPLFDRNKGAYRARSAEAQLAEARLRLAQDQIRSETDTLRMQTISYMQAARDYDAQALGSATELKRIALIAFEGGETGVFEIIDTLKSARDVELKSLALKRDAREAELDLNLRLPEIQP